MESWKKYRWPLGQDSWAACCWDQSRAGCVRKKMLAWSGTFPILWLSCFHVQLVPCGSDISTWDHRVPGLNRTCIGIVSEYLTMYLAYRTHASCAHVPCVPHPDNMRTLNAVPSCLSVPQMLYPCTLRTVPVHPAYRTSAPCVPYQCTLRTVPVYPAYRTQTTCVPWTLYPVAFLYLKCRTHVPCVPYPCTLRTVPPYQK